MVFKIPLLEDVMAKEIYGPGSPPHQTETQERVLQQVLKRLCNDAKFRESVVEYPETLTGFDLSPEQQLTLIAVGHASGRYKFVPGVGFCCCCGPDDRIQSSGLLTSPAATWEGNLGPLTPLAGTWEGDQGYDTAPSEDRGEKETRYREKMKFEPIGPVKNHEQDLFGFEYSTKIWRLDNGNQFHEEVGYWLWDPEAKQVLVCIIVPRGVNVLAGGTVEPNAKKFKLSAKAGSQTYGICSNLYLDEEFKTVRYELEVVINDNRSFSYYEKKQLQIKGKPDIFDHTDKNTLIRSK
jgi:hypothetical protein